MDDYNRQLQRKVLISKIATLLLIFVTAPLTANAKDPKFNVKDQVNQNSADIAANSDAICQLADTLGMCISVDLCADVCPNRLVFISDNIYLPSQIDSLNGADAICNEDAEAAGLPGVYRAWLSDDSASPSTRFNQYDIPYELVTGTRIANNWEDLTDGSIQNRINRKASGGLPGPSDVTAWTGTDIDGTALGANCSNWTSDTGNGRAGSLLDKDASWTKNPFANNCGQPWHLYCFQQ